jgi:hypothetical protein
MMCYGALYKSFALVAISIHIFTLISAANLPFPYKETYRTLNKQLLFTVTETGTDHTCDQLSAKMFTTQSHVSNDCRKYY